MKPIDLDGFERLFQTTADPWDYRTSRFEERKRGVLLRACGVGPFGRGLELACAIGATSRALQRRCLSLVATDGAPTALAEARRLTAADSRIDYRLGVLPEDLPRGPFDLVVVSEIAYYLSPKDLADLARRLWKATAPGGRLVVLHHLVPFDDAAQPPARAQSMLRRLLARHMRLANLRRCRRYEAATYRQPRPSRHAGNAQPRS